MKRCCAFPANSPPRVSANAVTARCAPLPQADAEPNRGPSPGGKSSEAQLPVLLQWPEYSLPCSPKVEGGSLDISIAVQLSTSSKTRTLCIVDNSLKASTGLLLVLLLLCRLFRPSWESFAKVGSPLRHCELPIYQYPF